MSLCLLYELYATIGVIQNIRTIYASICVISIQITTSMIVIASVQIS
jgi:hypothetical protein